MPKLYIDSEEDFDPKKSKSKIAANHNNSRNKLQTKLYGEELSPLEWLFIEKYLLSFNQTQSYIQAQKETTGNVVTSVYANRESNRLLKEKKVQDGIKLFRKEILNKIQINREQFVYWVVDFLNKTKEEDNKKLQLDTLKYLGTILGFSTPNNFHVNNKFLVNVGGFNPDEQLKKLNEYTDLTPQLLNEKLKEFQFENINSDLIIEENNIEIEEEGEDNNGEEENS